MANSPPDYNAVSQAAPALPPGKSLRTALLLLIFFGAFGAHRFYLGRPRGGVVLIGIFLAYAVAAMLAIGFVLIVLGEMRSPPDIPLLRRSVLWLLIATLPFNYPAGVLVAAYTCVTGSAAGFDCIGALAGGTLILMLVQDWQCIMRGRPWPVWPRERSATTDGETGPR